MLPRFRAIVFLVLLIGGGASGCATYHDWANDACSSGCILASEADWPVVFDKASQGRYH